LVKWPGITKPGSVCSEPVIRTDFYPTMLEMANLPLRPKQHLDGKRWLPLLKGKAMVRGPIFWHYPHYGNQGGSPGSAVRDGDWKLIVWYEDKRRELYNLQEDIGEQHNLIDQYPDIVQRLDKILQSWLKKGTPKGPLLIRIYYEIITAKNTL
jgi:arylsulfatase A-like enzyme